MKRILTVIFMALIAVSWAFAGEKAGEKKVFPYNCTTEELSTSQTKARSFINDYLKGESSFFLMTRHPKTGLTYDGFDLDPQTGRPLKARYWSAPSKECLDLAILALAVDKNPRAALAVCPWAPEKAPEKALRILERKLNGYMLFHERFPGYGGYMPWFYSMKVPVESVDWIGEIPGLDNGEWAWSMLTVEYILKKRGHIKLAEGYGKYNKILIEHAVPMFYDREEGLVRGDVKVSEPSDLKATYSTISGKPGRCSHLTGEHGVHEGMMMVLFVSLFGKNITPEEIDRIWSRTAMVPVEHKYGTTWQGYWGSAHESWAYLFLPLQEIPCYGNLFRIREKIRTHNASERKYPGFATSAGLPGKDGYMSGAGIEGVGSQKLSHNDTYAVYGVFPLLLETYEADNPHKKSEGLVWLLNSIRAPRMYGPLGSGESSNNDGSAVSYVKTIDGSFPNIIALSGGLGPATGRMLKERGLYKKFISIMEKEYNEAFQDKSLKEPDIFALPSVKVPKEKLLPYKGLKKPKVSSASKIPVLSGREYLRQNEPGQVAFLFDEQYREGLSLDGRWKVVAYFDGKGNKIEGAKAGFEYVKVPGHWLTQGYYDTTGMVLERRFEVPRIYTGKRWVLHFGGIIYYASFNLNGKSLLTAEGKEIHEGYFFPVEMDVTDKVIPGKENILRVTVKNPNELPDTDLSTKNGGTGFPHWGANKRDILGVLDFHDTKPGISSHQRFNVGGIWLPVRLYKKDPVHITGIPMANTTLFNIPPGKSLPEKAHCQFNFHVPLKNSGDKPVKVKITVDIIPENFSGNKSDYVKIEKEILLKPGVTNTELAAVISNARLWWPWSLGRPNLYRARIYTEQDRRETDSRWMVIGARQMEGDVHGAWKLNGRTVRILGDNVIPSLTPGTYSGADAIRDGRLIINANVLLVRIHAHTAHPRFLEMTDQLGILVWQDFPQQWLSRWDEEYSNQVLRQMDRFARIMISHPSVVLINCHNENNCFDPKNAHGLPSLKRGVWMHASRPAMELDHRCVQLISNLYRSAFQIKAAVKPRAGILVNPETGAQYHPYYGYYYGEGSLDFFFLPTPDKKEGFPSYDPFSPLWGWREDGHPDSGVGAVPTTSYERVAGGGDFNCFGPDEFGFQGFSPYAVDLAIREVVRKNRPDIDGAQLKREVENCKARIPWGYIYAPHRLPAPDKRTEAQQLYVQVIDKLEEHSLQAYTFPLWMKPEKPIEKITLKDITDASQDYQAWGAQLCAEIYRRAGYGQTRFMFFASEDDHQMLYSLDWAVLESNRNPKKAYYSVQRAYQPVLATSNILTRRLVAGEPWMDGLWLHNDTYHRLSDLKLCITLKNPQGEAIEEQTLSGLTLEPFQIQSIGGKTPQTLRQIDPSLPAGKYMLSLQIQDRDSQPISTNIYQLQLLPGNMLQDLSPEKREKAARILSRAYGDIKKHFQDMGLSVEQKDTWPVLISKLKNLRTARWEEWKAKIQANPEQLLDFPEFSGHLGSLINALYRMDSARERLEAVKDPKARKEATDELHQAKAIYNEVLDKTRKTLVLNSSDLTVLSGKRGARIPIPLFYGEEITTDLWFLELISELEKAGADKTAENIRKYYNCRESHWFDRQIKIYKALMRIEEQLN